MPEQRAVHGSGGAIGHVVSASARAAVARSRVHLALCCPMICRASGAHTTTSSPRAAVARHASIGPKNQETGPSSQANTVEFSNNQSLTLKGSRGRAPAPTTNATRTTEVGGNHDSRHRPKLQTEIILWPSKARGISHFEGQRRGNQSQTGGFVQGRPPPRSREFARRGGESHPPTSKLWKECTRCSWAATTCRTQRRVKSKSLA